MALVLSLIIRTMSSSGLATSHRHGLAFVLLCFVPGANLHAESWPPLKAPDPLTVEWVVKQTLTRYPEVHARHRAYLAALARVPAPGVLGSGETRKLKIDVAESVAALVFVDALEHHLMLKWQAEQSFYDYLLAQESLALIQNQRGLWQAYIPAAKARQHETAASRDLALETAQLNALALKFTNDRASAALRINTLVDRPWQTPLTAAQLGEPHELPPGRDALVKKALQHSVAMRRAQTELKRASALLPLAEKGEAGNETRDAATHEVARFEQQRRAAGVNTVRDVTLHYDSARLKLDALKYYQGEALPRAGQRVDAALAAYKAGSGEVMSMLDAYQAQVAVQIEALRLRSEYEKSISDLEMAVGVLPDYAIRTMSERPLNTIRDPNAKK